MHCSLESVLRIVSQLFNTLVFQELQERQLERQSQRNAAAITECLLYIHSKYAHQVTDEPRGILHSPDSQRQPSRS